jgi:hypothetical protein
LRRSPWLRRENLANLELQLSFFLIFSHAPPSPLEFFFDFFLARFWEGKKRWEGREKENEGTDDVS